MKTAYKLFLTLALIIGSVASIHAQNTASATGAATSTVVQNITLTWEQPLAFGQITPSGSDGTAVMDLSGVNVLGSGKINKAPTTTNCTEMSTSQPNQFGGNQFPGPAVFEVTGQLGWTFAITLPTAAVPCNLIDLNPGGAPALVVDNFKATVGNPGVQGTTGTLSVGIGIQDFAVGGTLHVPANTVPGRYQGTFLVSVNYN